MLPTQSLFRRHQLADVTASRKFRTVSRHNGPRLRVEARGATGTADRRRVAAQHSVPRMESAHRWEQWDRRSSRPPGPGCPARPSRASTPVAVVDSGRCGFRNRLLCWSVFDRSNTAPQTARPPLPPFRAFARRGSANVRVVPIVLSLTLMRGIANNRGRGGRRPQFGLELVKVDYENTCG